MAVQDKAVLLPLSLLYGLGSLQTSSKWQCDDTQVAKCQCHADSAAFTAASPAGPDCYSKELATGSLTGTMVVADASDTEKDLSPLARANSENPWGPKRSVGSFTSGVSGRARGDASPRLRGAYAEIQIKVWPMRLRSCQIIA